ncbi:saxitoxin and tetrodotoxin-binding protein 1-like [Pholidichthys leucotaenia]
MSQYKTGFRNLSDFFDLGRGNVCRIRMSRVKLVVLLLAVLAIGSYAAPTLEECVGLTKRLPTRDLSKAYGKWVLVWSVANNFDLLDEVSTSIVEVQLHSDNKTIDYHERNLMKDNSCHSYFMKTAVPTDSDSDHHTLHIKNIRLEHDGTHKHYNETGEVDLYQSCDDCLTMLYRASGGKHFLLQYRREGTHGDEALLRSAHSSHKKQAECLGFTHEKEWNYNGVTDFCHKKSAQDECVDLNKRLPTKNLNTIFGDWVLVWSMANEDTLWDDITTSHVELRLHSDNKTIQYDERNRFSNNSCIIYFMNTMVPADSDAEHHTLHINDIRVEQDGAKVAYDETGEVDVFQDCDDCLTMVYRTSLGKHFLLHYRREGKHRDLVQLKSAHNTRKKQAECLGITSHKVYSYDGVTDFCHKKSAPNAKPEES